MWILTLQFTTVAVSAAAYTSIIGPLSMTAGRGGAGAWGIIEGAEALGALAGAFIATCWRPTRPMLIAAIFPCTVAVPLALTAVAGPWPAIVAAMLLPGICQTIYAVAWTIVLQNTFPPDLLARVNRWTLLGSLALTPPRAADLRPTAGHDRHPDHRHLRGTPDHHRHTHRPRLFPSCLHRHIDQPRNSSRNTGCNRERLKMWKRDAPEERKGATRRSCSNRTVDVRSRA
ncbi:hypothetical protein [Actinomadura rubrisoli]|uniref:MFS transporter n=1 Tax=Actinomadura rubrisoli TaxID=2530368 RepID=A0A4R5B5Y2_9ACTN|nr:hypothetical protein [Actinomadura rubrisoli]TDD79044.1 hypothetical protein E1298_28615 [Actinomadura rubrisoli]